MNLDDVNIITEEEKSKKAEKDYLEFLDDQEDQGIYTNLVKNMVDENKYRLIVNINDLRKKNPTRAEKLLNESYDEIVYFQRALKFFASNVNEEYAKGDAEFFIGLEGSFGHKHTTPRTLTSKFLGNMVCVEGIAIKCSLIKTKVIKSVHYCSATKSLTERRYTDLTSFEAFPTSSVYPTHDENDNPLETEYGLSSYRDHQTLTIQEMPEKAPAGQLPRSVDVICDDDLVDVCKPGDRVQIVGHYRCLPGKKGGYTTGAFRTILLANNITLLNNKESMQISLDDVAMSKNFVKNNSRKDIFELLSRSLAPSIFGHEYVKKAILCLLLGGLEKILPNGTRLRGDINVLLIGDPSVAKSQLLRYVLSIAPRAITTTGRGSSGVGLTAAVTSDSETGERRLEAGAMVLADRGVICIDEFDKMSDIDRTAIHEVMEQGKVTIAKAGIQASLNARCSVLAAANPVYGRYNQYKSPMENIGLQDSLLSRFDLLFVMLDTIDADTDHVISDHVVRTHRYRNPTEQEGEALPFNLGLDYLSTKNPDVEDLQTKETQIYEKYEPLLHGKSRKKNDQILTAKFMKKFIHIARCMKPKLTEEACDCIAEEYSRLRSDEEVASDVARTQPITARTLETLIRLSTAHAKARLSRTVDIEDAEAAIELVQYAYFKRVLTKEKKRRRRIDSEMDEGDEDQQENINAGEQRKSKRSRKQSSSTVEPMEEDVYEFDDANDMQIDEENNEPNRGRALRSKATSQSSAATSQESIIQISDERLDEFRKLLHKIFTAERTDNLPKQKIFDDINAENNKPFSNDEFKAALKKMEDENRLMFIGESIQLI